MPPSCRRCIRGCRRCRWPVGWCGPPRRCRPHLHTPNGTVTDRALYDLFGDPFHSTGDFDLQVGCQGDWTEPPPDKCGWVPWTALGLMDAVRRRLGHSYLVEPLHLRRGQPAGPLGPLGMYTALINKFAGEGSYLAGVPEPKSKRQVTTQLRRGGSVTTRQHRRSTPVPPAAI